MLARAALMVLILLCLADVVALWLIDVSLVVGVAWHPLWDVEHQLTGGWLSWPAMQVYHVGLWWVLATRFVIVLGAALLLARRDWL